MLRREVSLTRVLPDVWDASQDPFVTTVVSRPLVALRLPPSPDRSPGTTTEAGTEIA